MRGQQLEVARDEHVVRRFKRGERGVLHEVRGIRGDMALQVGNRLHHRRGRGKKSRAPARHAIRLRQRTDENRPRLHRRHELHDVVMRGGRIDQFVVALVEHADQIVLQNQRGDFLQHGGGINHARRIVRRVEENALGARRDEAREFVGVDLKSVVRGF